TLRLCGGGCGGFKAAHLDCAGLLRSFPKRIGSVRQSSPPSKLGLAQRVVVPRARIQHAWPVAAAAETKRIRARRTQKKKDRARSPVLSVFPPSRRGRLKASKGG